MIGVHIDVVRLAALAEALRVQIPNVSCQAARPMIDAAGELQRLADQFGQLHKQLDQQAVEIAGGIVLGGPNCQCRKCVARRAAAAPSTPGDLN